MKLESSGFRNNERMPDRFTLDFDNLSPSLKWSDIPEDTREFALVCDDPDAPVGTWVHWVLYNMPPDTKGLAENIPPDENLPNGAKQGISDFRRIGYGGPCPPGGTHRYFFKIYALDTTLDLKSRAAKSDLVNAMEGHILARGQLIGKYKRQ